MSRSGAGPGFVANAGEDQMMRIASRPGLMLLSASLLLIGCSPEVGSDAWCKELRDKSKVEWTAEEVKGFTNYCVGRNP